MKPAHVVGALERLHADPGLERDAWLAQTARDLFEVLGSTALSFTVMEQSACSFVDAVGLEPEAADEFRQFARRDMPQQMTDEQFSLMFRRPRLVEQWTDLDLPRLEENAGPYRRRLGAADGIMFFLEPVVGVGLMIGGGEAGSFRLGAARRAALTRLALHVETATRIRLSPDAVIGSIDPSGRLELGTHVPPGHERARLAEHVSCIESLRTRAHRQDGETALQLWQALTAGHLSLRERIDTDGKRLYDVCENPPHRRWVRALTKGQALAVEYASRGLGNKEIAYALGYSQAYVSRLLGEAAAKLGLDDGRALLRVANALSRPPPHDAGAQLTPAERAVLALLSEGLSNAEIASRRGSAQRTVANQVASVLAKTGSGNRRALLGRS